MGLSRWVLALAIAAALVMLLLIVWPGEPRRAEVTDEPVAQQYGGNLDFSAINLSRLEARGDQIMISVQGRVANNGNLPVRAAMVELRFFDQQGQPIHVQTEPLLVLEAEDGAAERTLEEQPLRVNETAGFRIEAGPIPPQWNNQPPEIRVVNIVVP